MYSCIYIMTEYMVEYHKNEYVHAKSNRLDVLIMHCMIVIL